MGASKTNRGQVNGAPVVFKDGEWVYAETQGKVTAGEPQPCPYCGKKPGLSGEDGCLGRLPGVKAACCGHGKEGYILFENGIQIRFQMIGLPAFSTPSEPSGLWVTPE